MNDLVQAEYTNHKGRTATRTFLPVKIWFGCTAFHREAQWLVQVFDLEKQQTRDFALANFKGGWRRLGDTESAS
jgi:predicted DNA-binding transcriptional regulator YafY